MLLFAFIIAAEGQAQLPLTSEAYAQKQAHIEIWREFHEHFDKINEKISEIAEHEKRVIVQMKMRQFDLMPNSIQALKDVIERVTPVLQNELVYLEQQQETLEGAKPANFTLRIDARRYEDKVSALKEHIEKIKKVLNPLDEDEAGLY